MIKKIFDTFFQNNKDELARRVFEANSFHPDYDRIYHFHVRKTGGTSINMGFLQTNGEVPAHTLYDSLSNEPDHQDFAGNKIFVGWNKRLIEKGHYFYAFSHIPYHKLKLPENTFKFTSLRDPVNRVISHYKMLRNYQVNNIQHPCMKTEGPWLGKNLGDFISNIPKDHLLRQIYMFSPTFDVVEAAEVIKSLNYYLFTVSLKEDMTQLGIKLNLELETFHEKEGEYDDVFTDDELQRLREMMEPEYKLLRLLE